ncbi:unnamed protein product [Brassica oleracea var. botrytis]
MASLFPLLLLVLLTVSLAESKTYWGDVAALKEFKNSVDAKSMTPGSCLSSWDFSVDPCDNLSGETFTCGFRCDTIVSGSGRVTELILDQAGYSGSLSSLSFNFPYLQTLKLSDNYFSGPLPDSLSNLTRLTSLFLSGNSFSGPIPGSLGSIPLLEELLLDNNNLNGSVPTSFNRLSRLKRLELQQNNISGELPDLTSLKSLNYLDVSDNRISGPVPSSLPSPNLNAKQSLPRNDTRELQKLNLSRSYRSQPQRTRRLDPIVHLRSPNSPTANSLLQRLHFVRLASLLALGSPQRANLRGPQQQQDQRPVTSVHGPVTEALSFVVGEQQLLRYGSDAVRLENRVACRVSEAVTRRELLVWSRTGSFDGAQAWLGECAARWKLLLVVSRDVFLLSGTRTEISYGVQKV